MHDDKKTPVITANLPMTATEFQKRTRTKRQDNDVPISTTEETTYTPELQRQLSIKHLNLDIQRNNASLVDTLIRDAVIDTRVPKTSPEHMVNYDMVEHELRHKDTGLGYPFFDGDDFIRTLMSEKDMDDYNQQIIKHRI